MNEYSASYSPFTLILNFFQQDRVIFGNHSLFWVIVSGTKFFILGFEYLLNFLIFIEFHRHTMDFFFFMLILYPTIHQTGLLVL